MLNLFICATAGEWPVAKGKERGGGPGGFVTVTFHTSIINTETKTTKAVVALVVKKKVNQTIQEKVSPRL